MAQARAGKASGAAPQGESSIEDAIRNAEREADDAVASAAHRASAARIAPSSAGTPMRGSAGAASRAETSDSVTVDVSDAGTPSAPPSPAASKPPGAQRPARRRCRLPTPQHAVERTVSRAFGRIGLLVGRHPVASIVLSVLFALALASGLTKVRFEARSHKLYIPQNDFMADDRRYIEGTFGETPEPGILIVSRKDGAPIDDHDTVSEVLSLHDRVTTLAIEYMGRNVSYGDVCYRRFVGMLDRYECVVSSPLELWWYQREQLDADEYVEETMRDALASHREDFGTDEDGRIMAMQLKYFFRSRGEIDGGGDGKGEYAAYRAWEAAVRANVLGERVSGGAHVDADGDANADAHDGGFDGVGTDGIIVHAPPTGFDASTSPLAVAYWSTNYNEEEAQSFVQDDSYLMALSLVFITVYVCITLGGVTADCRQTRLLLGSTCAVCTGLAMASGFGLASMLGVPLQPISPIVCFTLLGVAVDDMIIIVMAFEATDPERDVAERLSRALSRAGSTITVTSVTSAVAFLTGYFVDFPALAYFCVPASLCIVMVYFLQMTFFAACLTLDAKRAAAARLDCFPCVVLTDDQVYRVPRMLGRDPSAAEMKPPRVRPLQVCVHKHWARILLSNPMRAFVLITFLSLAGTAGYAMRHIKVGLPPRLSLPDGSPILDFIDDLDVFWQGTQMQEVQLVLKDVNLGESRTLRAINDTVHALEALPFVLRFAPRFDEAYLRWRNCTWVEVMRTADLGKGINMDAFLEDSDTHTCGQEDDAPDGEDEDEENDPTCMDDDTGFMRLSSGRPCSVAVSHCHRGTTGWRIVSKHCPKTCGLCGAAAEAAAEADAIAPADDMAGSGAGAHEKGMPTASSGGAAAADTDAPPGVQVVEGTLGRAGMRRHHHRAAQRQAAVAATKHAPAIDIGPTSGAIAAARRAATDGAFVDGAGGSAGAGAARRQLQFLGGGGTMVHGGKQFEADVVSGGGQVAAEARMYFYVHMSNDNKLAWEEYQTMVEVVGRQATLLPGAIVYHFKYEFAYCDLLMPLFGLKNLLMAACTIFCVVCLFLPASIAFVSTFTVMCIDAILLGLITAAGMSLNTITLVTLLLALALAIDYSCHIGHAYVVARGRTRKEKVTAAIETIGFSIINAAGSTLLGTLFLAASQSPVFRIFFVLVWTTIFLGLISGMAFVPVVLSFIGPLDPDGDHDEGLHDLQLDASMHNKAKKNQARREQSDVAAADEAEAAAAAAAVAATTRTAEGERAASDTSADDRDSSSNDDASSEHYYTPTAARAEAHRASVKWALPEGSAPVDLAACSAGHRRTESRHQPLL